MRQPPEHQALMAAALTPSDVVISVLVPPLLLGLFLAQRTAGGLQQLGRTSEELFRGERLPFLPVPPDAQRPLTVDYPD